MIPVDTSIWIELSRGRLHPISAEEESVEYVTCAPIVQEVIHRDFSALARYTPLETV